MGRGRLFGFGTPEKWAGPRLLKIENVPPGGEKKPWSDRNKKVRGEWKKKRKQDNEN